MIPSSRNNANFLFLGTAFSLSTQTPIKTTVITITIHKLDSHFNLLNTAITVVGSKSVAAGTRQQRPAAVCEIALTAADFEWPRTCVQHHTFRNTLKYTTCPVVHLFTHAPGHLDRLTEYLAITLPSEWNWGCLHLQLYINVTTNKHYHSIIHNLYTTATVYITCSWNEGNEHTKPVKNSSSKHLTISSHDVFVSLFALPSEEDFGSALKQFAKAECHGASRAHSETIRHTCHTHNNEVSK